MGSSDASVVFSFVFENRHKFEGVEASRQGFKVPFTVRLHILYGNDELSPGTFSEEISWDDETYKSSPIL